MLALLALLLAAPPAPGIKNTTPSPSDYGLVVRQIGTVDVNCVTGCSGGSSGLTDTQLRALPVSVTFTNTAISISGSVPVTGPLTDSQLRATAVPVSGPLTDTQLRATPVPVSLSSVPSHAVTGPLTDTQLRASAVPVSGTVTANAGSGTMAVSGPVTDTQLRASAVPVSLASVPAHAVTQATGSNLHVVVDTAPSTAVTGPLTDTQLRASAVPTSLASVPTHAVTGSGTFNVTQVAAGGHPCQNPSATLAMVNGSTSGTAAVQLIALSGTAKIYVCSLVVVGVSGTTPTFSLSYGTGTACATGNSVILGSWTTAANTVYSFPFPFAVTPGGQALCYVQTGTSPVSRYVLTYVQI